MFIVGWGDRQKTVGSLKQYQCPDCHNTATWHLTKTRTWLRLFFVPVLPVATADYWRVCPICGWAIEVSEDAVSDAKAAATEPKGATQ